jgi:hypothetical protein
MAITELRWQNFQRDENCSFDKPWWLREFVFEKVPMKIGLEM